MQIAIQRMFWMAIVDLEQFHFIHSHMREKIEVVQDVCASLAEPLKELTLEMNFGRAWDEQRRTRKVKLGRERKWLSVKTTELESYTHWRTLKFPCGKSLIPAFLPVLFHFSLGVRLLFSWWLWLWRDCSCLLSVEDQFLIRAACEKDGHLKVFIWLSTVLK